ncbi:MAG: thiamine-phosphate kinase [Crenarchaeota archaeon 13_1_40CM_2_52_14]|nr:MAG: thiamine-phosphate kinase [Crenarchaeota archaeon 13_1_40CM_3_52_17]OLD35519.1 MAG: thiamine-phosphate kinase [Crenarchaeota archaeon 13_1_40CM_2_52_14]
MTSLTEREIICILTKQFARQLRPLLGFNDDVSAIPLSSKTWIIVKTDMLVGSTDIPPGMTIQEAGRKAVVAAVSDFAAKGVQPTALMVSLGLPGPVARKTVQNIAFGLSQAAREYHCKIIGGDTNQADDLVIDVAGVGVANPKKLVRRDGARVGDVVAVTGPFGNPAAGLRILMSREKKKLANHTSLVNAVLRPKARLTEGIILAKSGGVTSSIDSSDGLAWSLHQIARASLVGINLHTIPVAPAAQSFAKERRISAIELALYGGEEYELLVTVAPNRFSSLKKRVPSLKRIGIVEKGSEVVAHLDGRRIQVEERGWEHFR